MRKRLYLFITICWLAAIGTLLFYPLENIPSAVEKITYADKAAHLAMFGVLTYLIMAIGIRWNRRKFFWISLAAFSFSVIANFSAEFIQAFIPGRTPSFLDFLAGLFGTILAVPVTYLLHYSPKPKAVLHVCCAPCATAVKEILEKDYRLEFFFSNSNIYPRQEYQKRLKEVKKLAGKFWIKVHEDKYNHTAWKREVSGLEKEPEGGARCELCFRQRLTAAAKIAKDKKADFFATTLTIGPHKNSILINKIGEDIGKHFGASFLENDFKKNGGFQRSIFLSKKFNLYRQKYCGCEFSIKTAGAPRRIRKTAKK